mgnify:CR=1 FL=1
MRTVLIVFAFMALVGCGSTADESAAAGVTPADSAKDAAVTEEAVRSEDAKVINDPGQAVPGGAYRIEPSNPSDPKYQADPALAGGG